MPVYEVELEHSCTYKYNILAPDEEAAEERALEAFLAGYQDEFSCSDEVYPNERDLPLELPEGTRYDFEAGS